MNKILMTLKYKIGYQLSMGNPGAVSIYIITIILVYLPAY